MTDDLVQLVLATHNEHKIAELRRILGAHLEGIELIGYDGPDPVEDGETFAENALIKARAAAEHTGLPAIADDSGICVDALDGGPGIHSARFAGTRNDADNLHLLLQKLAGVEDRTAHFFCAAAFVSPDGTEAVRSGRWDGQITQAPAGGGGFGYDPIFLPEDAPVTAAELSRADKDALSHRALAFTALVPVLRWQLLGEELHEPQQD